MYYIEKLSVTQTFDQRVPTNTIFIFHGTMCPDGLFPCDGKWRDMNGRDTNAYTIMPEVNNLPGNTWQTGSYYEESPNLWDRTIKQISETTLPYQVDAFSVDRQAVTTTGGSADTGDANDISAVQHRHQYIHTHESGDLEVANSQGLHTHTDQNITRNIKQVLETIEVSETPGSGLRAARNDHRHNYTITGGQHGHASSTVTGNTGDPDITNTDYSNSWPPYKEIIFCIKK
jgi:hypothetical protein